MLARSLHHAIAALAGTLALFALGACTDDVPTAPAPAALRTDVAPASGTPGDAKQALLDSLARGFAAAMADAQVRAQVLEDLRDAPFEDHAIHFSSYVQGPRGRDLARAIAEHGGLPLGRVVAASVAQGGLQLVMPGMADRALWSGTPDVLVAAVARPPAEFVQTATPATGFTPNGQTVRFALDDHPGGRVLLLEPAVVAFGTDPEQARAAAPHQNRRTVSTRGEALAAELRQQHDVGPHGLRSGPMVVGTLSLACDPETAIVPCDGGGGGGGYPVSWDGIKLASGKRWADCTVYATGYDGHPITDADDDKWDDGCESELALAFEPTFAWSWRDCNMMGEPYFSATDYVKPDATPTHQLTIFYAIGYHRDCGSPVLNTGLTGHIGDSEFIVLNLGWAPNPNAGADPLDGKWYTWKTYLSAHWNTPSTASSYYDGRDMQYNSLRTSFLGRPNVWVAEDKHGNYRTQGACDAGAFYTDNCDRNQDNGWTLLLPSTANLGQSYLPFLGASNSAVTSRDLARGGHPEYGGVEYYWTSDRFHGWYTGPFATDAGASPYRDPLILFGF